VLPKERFAANLRRLRDEAGLTQMQLGNCADVDHSVISRYERAMRDPQLEAIAALAKALGVSACALVEGIPESDASPASPAGHP
jgi:transcriptional regulator with XRE-family HTH domain